MHLQAEQDQWGIVKIMAEYNLQEAIPAVILCNICFLSQRFFESSIFSESTIVNVNTANAKTCSVLSLPQANLRFEQLICSENWDSLCTTFCQTNYRYLQYRASECSWWRCGNGHMAAKLSIALTHSSVCCLFWNNFIHFTVSWGNYQDCTDCFPGCLGPDKSLYTEATSVNRAYGVLPRSYQRKWSLWVFTGIFLSSVLRKKKYKLICKSKNGLLC